MEIGKVLKQVREEKGLTLQQVEEETKIRRKYIEAIEEEKFEVLPGPVYVKAFIKTYAKYLGINSEELVAGLTDLSTDMDEVSAPKEEVSKDLKDKPHFSWQPRYLAYILVVLLVGTVALFSAAYNENINMLTEENNPKTPSQPQQSEQEQVERNKDNGNQENSQVHDLEQNKGVNLKLNVTTDQSWMLVMVDGETAFEGIVSAGESKDFSAQENIWFKLGNTGAVEVQYNGKNLGYLGKKGQVEDFPQEYLEELLTKSS